MQRVEKRYYRYTFGESINHQVFYFHDPVMNLLTWERPTDGDIFDGKTNEKITEDESVNDDSSDTVMSTSSVECSPSPLSPLSSFRAWSSFDSTRSSKRCSRVCSRGKLDGLKHARRGTLNDLIDEKTPLPTILSTDTGSSQYYVPESIGIEAAEEYNVDADLQDHLKLRKHGKLMGKKKRATPAEALSYNLGSKDSDIPLVRPSQKTEKSGIDKKATALWSMVVSYCQDPKTTMLPSKIIEFIVATPELIDEAFLQCCKLTRGHQNESIISRAVDLLLVLSTIFTTSQKFQKFVTHTLAELYSNTESKAKAAPILLAYLRFRGKHMDHKSPFDWVDRMIDDPNYGGSLFRSCLEEQMWLQRNRAPCCPIPIFLPIAGRHIVELKAREKQDLFVSGVYGPHIDSLIEKVKRKEDPFDGATVETLIPFLRRWIIELGRPIVDAQYYKDLGTTDDEIVAWANRLPDLSRLTLKYLIGFLRYITKLDWDTTSGRSNVSQKMHVLFPTEQGDSKQAGTLGKRLFAVLIDHWNVDDMYPVPDEFQVPEKLFD